MFIIHILILCKIFWSINGVSNWICYLFIFLRSLLCPGRGLPLPILSISKNVLFRVTQKFQRAPNWNKNSKNNNGSQRIEISLISMPLNKVPSAYYMQYHCLLHLIVQNYSVRNRLFFLFNKFLRSIGPAIPAWLIFNFFFFPWTWSSIEISMGP